jgi:fructose-1,6-bisphosphatase/inositol monophosphatase family enzyme
MNDLELKGLLPWDTAAATIIAKEAGVRTGHYRDPPKELPVALHSTAFMAAIPSLFGSLKELLAAT